MKSLSLQMAWRNLTRKRRRTFLSVAGVAVSCAVCLITLGMSRGKVDMFFRITAEGGIGHLRLAPAGWEASRDAKLRLMNWQKDLAALRRTPQVAVATPRTRAQGLLAMGTHVAAVDIAGVDPATEPGAYKYVRRMTTGRYLRTGDQNGMVLGQETATTLKIEAGDPVVVTAVGADGSMKSAMFTLLGTVATGNSEIDASICQVNLPDLEQLGQAPGAGEITMILKDPLRTPEVQKALRPLVSAPNQLLRWDEVSPQTRTAIELNRRISGLTTVVLMIVALLGVASAQLTAVLERQKELGMLLAIGMSGRRILLLILAEALGVGLLGTVLALVLAVPVLYYLAVVGIPVAKGMSAGGMLMEAIYANFGLWIFTDGLLLCVAAAILAALYPAWFAVKLDPISAMRVSQ
jgi:ABC-type lipoprotein release transport system permease subunit